MEDIVAPKLPPNDSRVHRSEVQWWVLVWGKHPVDRAYTQR